MSLKPPDALNNTLSSLELHVPYTDLGTYALPNTSNQQSGWDSAVDATPIGGTLFIPSAPWYVPTPTCDRRINIVGEGIGSALIVSGGAGVDGFVYDPGTLVWGTMLRDFSVIGLTAGSCRYGFVARHMADSILHDIYVKAGGTWEVSIEGLLVCKTRFRLPGANALFPYDTGLPLAPAVRSTNGMRVVGGVSHPSNANTLDDVIEALTGQGLLVDATVGSPGSFNNEVSGTYQGITGKPIHIKGASHWKISHVHVEAAGTVTIEDCSDATIGPAAYMGVDVDLINSDDIDIDGAVTDVLTIDSNCQRTKLGRVYYNALAGGTIVDNGVGTVSDGRLINNAGANTSRALPGPIESLNLLRSDGLRIWQDGTIKPVGSTISAGTITKAGDGQGDTRKLFSPFSGLMAGASAVYFEGTSADALRETLGNYVTLSAWVYIPSGQANQPNVTIEANVVGGLGTATGQATSATDVWTHLTLTVPVDGAATQLNLKLRNTVASTGNWYISYTSCVLGRSSPRARLSPKRDYRYAELTFDPADIPDGTVLNQNITVQGCALGDKVAVSWSLGTFNGILITGRVVAANTVQVTILNHSTAAANFASGVMRVETWSY